MGFSIPQTARSAAARRQVRTGGKGFSLAEVLVVVAVIGVLAALVMPAVGNLLWKTKCTVSRKQAHTVANLYSAAKAAGVVFPDETREGIVEALSAPGGVKGQGIFADTSFGLSMSEVEKEELKKSNILVEGTMPDGTRFLQVRAN